jgi:drug/metabolite transporter (DMT)-like permease
VSSAVLGAALALHGRLGHTRPSLAASAAAGALDSLANFAFLLAVRDGDLAVVAVITALYPAATVLLARAFLAERIAPTQLAGLGLAAVAVSLLAVG